MSLRGFRFYDSSLTSAAVIYRDRTFTFRTIDEQVEYLFDRLAKRVITDQPRIGILADNNPLFVCSLLAVARIGASAVLFSTYLKKYEIQDCVEEAGIQLLITDKKLDDTVENLPLEKSLVHSGTNSVLADHSIWYISQPTKDVDDSQHSERLRDREFILQFTSGVSGKSRLVSRSYSNVIDEIMKFSNTVAVTKEDVFICPVPLFHAYGLINGFLPSFHMGSRLILMEKFVPNDFIILVEKYRPTLFLGVPFMYSLLGQTFLPEKVDFSCFRFCFSAGAKLSEDAARDFTSRFGVRPSQLYGSTETGIISVNLYEDGFSDVNSVGKPIEGRVVRIVDDVDQALPTGEGGEIKIRSTATTKGYLNREELNREVFNDGWFFTGDVGKLDDEGNLYVVGRKSSFINVAGLKVDPSEVENVLVLNDAVVECAVVGVPRQGVGETVKAYMVLQKDISRREIWSFCRERLADHKVPREIEFVPELPRSPTGKILKKYLAS
jgi:long-chain acyl-CoA synthetase